MKKLILTLATGASFCVMSGAVQLNEVQAKEMTKAVSAQHIVNDYAGLVYDTYTKTYNDAVNLQGAINAFLDNPNDETLGAAKAAWLVSRDSYGQTEAFRFYEGPIDYVDANGNEGPEGRLNAWPMDEAYIDYVKGNPTTGIVNDAKVTITKEMLTDKNQADDEAEVATGYHAI